MTEHISALKKCPLFAGIDQGDIPALLACLQARERRMQREEFLFSAGDRPENMGVVLAGSVRVVQEDYWGNRAILAVVEAGGLFGEAFVCARAETLPVSVVGHKEGSVLLIGRDRILPAAPAACGFHAALIANLMKILAGKNIALTRKMKHITKKTTREKVLSYLSECAVSSAGETFEIPFSRQELADYLSVERSALSATLGKMRDEGLLTFHKNRFRLM